MFNLKLKPMIYFAGKFGEDIDETSKKFNFFKEKYFQQWHVINPLLLNNGLNLVDKINDFKFVKNDNYDRALAYTFDVYSIMAADAVFALDNFPMSFGALGEVILALNLGKDIYLAEKKKNKKNEFRIVKYPPEMIKNRILEMNKDLLKNFEFIY